MVKDLSNYYKLNRDEPLQEGDIWIERGKPLISGNMVCPDHFNKTMNQNDFRDVNVYRENPKFKWSLGLKILN